MKLMRQSQQQQQQQQQQQSQQSQSPQSQSQITNNRIEQLIRSIRDNVMKKVTFEPIAHRVKRRQPKQTTLSNMKLAQLFSKSFRFIDDIASLNNEMFSGCLQQIYPATLIPTLQNKSSIEATFLDTKISILNNKFDMIRQMILISPLIPFHRRLRTSISRRQGS